MEEYTTTVSDYAEKLRRIDELEKQLREQKQSYSDLMTDYLNPKVKNAEYIEALRDLKERLEAHDPEFNLPYLNKLLE